jgi:hypothetical protein
LLRQLSGFESRHLSKIQKWAAKEWPTPSSPQKEIHQKKYRKKVLTQRNYLFILNTEKLKMKGFTIKGQHDGTKRRQLVVQLTRLTAVEKHIKGGHRIP